jgi:predicted nucleic acid-binding protein
MGIGFVDALLASPRVQLLAESETHWIGLRMMMSDGQVVAGRVHDARIAAICLEHGVRELWSADRDFSRFPALKVVNPLVA